MITLQVVAILFLILFILNWLYAYTTFESLESEDILFRIFAATLFALIFSMGLLLCLALIGLVICVAIGVIIV